ncbi:MAG TPA: ribosome recycling factor [Candidatus Paceibacterota bacterium]|jgi:ribosome recycling factor|nr:ribosome recycling factor [Candidatus Paceibacterota bacterium]
MQYNFSNFKIELKKAEEFLVKEYNQLNIGRASPMVLDGVTVESYGARVPLKNVASVSIEDPKTLRIAPWDKSQVKDIEKAIISANLGLSVATDDLGIRVIFPQLTTETRQTLVKVLKEKLEEQRIVVRHERVIVLEDIEAKEKEAKLTEDEKFRAKEELQKITEEANNNLEASFEKKQKEVMG